MSAVPRRNQIPLVLLAVLGVLTAVFAVLAISEVPNSADVTVTNATDATYTASSFELDLTYTVQSGPGSGVIKQVHRVLYKAPNFMLVAQTYPSVKLLGQIAPKKINSQINGYVEITRGSIGWTQHGSSTFTRTEPLVNLTDRTQPKSVSSGVSTVTGEVYETAQVQQGFLVSVKLKVIVPNQTLAGGQQEAGGIVGESFQLLHINGSKVGAGFKG